MTQYSLLALQILLFIILLPWRHCLAQYDYDSSYDQQGFREEKTTFEFNDEQDAQSQQMITVLREDYYAQSCPQAESIVRRAMVDHFQKNPLLAAGVLRLFFHDCFVRGCDGSVLLDSTPGAATPEKESQINNNSITGFRVIDSAKKKLELVCPGIVSCADALAMAARDAVWISGGPYWEVPVGRLDGRISLATEADNEIPSSDLSVRELRHAFLKKGLNTHDLVTLSGAHTIGRAHCFVFEDRLYNFSNTGLPDPSLDKDYLGVLRRICPRNTSRPLTVSLDKRTQVLFDNSYYHGVLSSNGLLQSDQELLFDMATMGLVRRYAGDVDEFFRKFAKSMVKLGEVGLKQPGEGEIRKHCRRVNK